jgi:hypothetical protein
LRRADCERQPKGLGVFFLNGQLVEMRNPCPAKLGRDK